MFPIRFQSRCALFRVAAGAAAVLVLLAGGGAQRSQPSAFSAILQALRAGDQGAALQLCDRDLATHPNDARDWLLRGMALAGLHRAADSLASFRHALRLRPHWLPALEGAAQSAYQSGDAQAQPLLQQLVRLQPANATAHAMLAALAFQHDDCRTALMEFQLGQAALGQAPRSLAEYGACLLRAGQPGAAEAAFRQWLALAPLSPAARYDLGLTQHQAHHDSAAMATLRPLLSSAPNRVDALNLIAAAEESAQHTAAAVAHLRQAILLAPSDPRNYLDLASISLAHHSYQVGVDVLNAGLQQLPGNASLYVARGVLLAQVARYDAAEADFRHAEQLQPQHGAGSVGMGLALMQTDRVGSAIRMLRQRLRARPDDAVLNYLLAEALQRAGMVPGSAPFQEAVAALHRALHARPDFAEARDELSALELRARQPRQAAADARRALQLQPSNPAPVYHLMLALRQLGQTSAAASLAQRLAALQTEAEKREAARGRVHLVEMPQNASPAHP